MRSCTAVHPAPSARGSIITQRVSLAKPEQTQAGVLGEQAPALLCKYPRQIRHRSDPYTRAVIVSAKSMALLKVASHKTRERSALTRTRARTVVRAPGDIRWLLTSQGGKAVQYWAGQVLTVPHVPRDEKCVETCGVRA